MTNLTLDQPVPKTITLFFLDSYEKLLNLFYYKHIYLQEISFILFYFTTIFKKGNVFKILINSFLNKIKIFK